MPNHPMQPMIRDDEGVIRFKKNSIVVLLLQAGPFNINALALKNFSQNDREQFAQLIGYSVDGFLDLPYIRDETKSEVEKQLEEFHVQP